MYEGILEALQQSKLGSQPKANVITTSPFALHSPSSHRNGKNSSLWILDTDATDHITFDLSSFTTSLHDSPTFPLYDDPLDISHNSCVDTSLLSTVSLDNVSLNLATTPPLAPTLDSSPLTIPINTDTPASFPSDSAHSASGHPLPLDYNP